MNNLDWFGVGPAGLHRNYPVYPTMDSLSAFSSGIAGQTSTESLHTMCNSESLEPISCSVLSALRFLRHSKGVQTLSIVRWRLVVFREHPLYSASVITALKYMNSTPQVFSPTGALKNVYRVARLTG